MVAITIGSPIISSPILIRLFKLHPLRNCIKESALPLRIFSALFINLPPMSPEYQVQPVTLLHVIPVSQAKGFIEIYSAGNMLSKSAENKPDFIQTIFHGVVMYAQQLGSQRNIP